MRTSRERFYRVRLVAITTGVPAVTLVSASDNARVRGVTVALSMAAAVSTASLEVLRFGPRWRVYRRYRGLLLAEGWCFASRAGSYRECADHDEALTKFVEKVEGLLARFEADYRNEVAVLGGAGGGPPQDGASH